MEFETDVLILGAGLTGLSAAFYLRGGKSRIAVLEKDGGPGGLSKTIRHGGYFFDLGGHRLYFKNPEIKKEILELLGQGGVSLHKRKSAIFGENGFLSYPPDIGSFYFFMNRFLSGSPRGRLRVKAAKNSLETWIVRNYGRKIYEMYFEEYTEKAWGLPASEIAAVWAEKRIDKANLFRLILDAVLKIGAVKENASSFHYPAGGIGDLAAALEKASGARTFYGAGELSLNFKGGKAVSAEFKQGGIRKKIKFKRLVSTIPLTEFAKAAKKDGAPLFPEKEDGIIPPPAYPSIRFKGSGTKTGISPEAGGGIRYRSLIVAFLAGEREKKLPYHWIYFPDGKFFFSRACELSNWTRGTEEEGLKPLTFEIFCDYGDGLWNMKDEEITEKILSQVSAIPEIAFKKITDFRIVRVKYAYPLLYLGYEKDLDRLLDRLSGFSNLSLCGRNGRHSYYDIEECLLDARETAEKIISKL